MFLDNIMSRI